VNKQQVIAPVDINLELSAKKTTVERRVMFRFADSALAKQLPSDAPLTPHSSAAQQNNTDQLSTNAATSGAAVGVADNLTVNTDADGHRLAIRPSMFNIIRTFRSTIDFSHDVEQYFFNRYGAVYRNQLFFLIFLRVDKQSAIQNYLTELLTKTFLPQIEDIIIQKFHGFVNGIYFICSVTFKRIFKIIGIDSFRVETIDEVETPIIKSSLQLIGLCKDLCIVGHAIPVHQEDFIVIMETMLDKYYEKCLVRYESLQAVESGNFQQNQIQSPGNEQQRILSASWLDNEEIVKLLRKNTHLTAELLGETATEVDRSYNDMLSKKEMRLEIQMQRERSVFRSEMIFDQTKLQTIASIRSSLVCVYTR
jgi:exocyst complex component 4